MNSLVMADRVRLPSAEALSRHVLNAFEIINRRDLAWDVRVYRAIRADGEPHAHADRGALKNAMWKIHNQHKRPSWGYGFVVDLDDSMVAVPAAWDFPSGATHGDYQFQLDKTFTAVPSDPRHTNIVAAIIREATRKRLKESNHQALGPLWQDYHDLCQMPNRGIARGKYIFVRRLRVIPQVLRNGLWVCKVEIRTRTLDARTLADYYIAGQADVLSKYIEAKRANRITRRNEPTAIRVWTESRSVGPRGQVLEIEDPGTIVAHAGLSRHEQEQLSTRTVRCRQFPRGIVEMPASDIRLILDTQITQEEHRDTIIPPEERHRLTHIIRDALDGTEVFRCPLSLAASLVTTDSLPMGVVIAPAIRVRDREKGYAIIPASDSATEEAFRRRAIRRMSHLRRHGFLEERSINPLLACPGFFGRQRSQRLLNDLNYILESMNIKYRFARSELYDDVHRLAQRIEQSDHDALFAVLPEDSTASSSDDTHEQIKRQIGLPSQCIRHSNTLPAGWVDKRPSEFKQQQPELAKRVRQRYELCLHNLLVKHHWVPFAPAEPSCFNVHVGLDVGGRHNTHVMACLGYGFSSPGEGLLFLPEEIPIDTQQREPIPTHYLYNGLLSIFSKARTELQDAGRSVNFERVVFYRDGEFLGHGDAWNEAEALKRLHAMLLERNWLTSDAVWMGVEIMKAAEGWRVFGSGSPVTNPLVGFWTRPFEDENIGLVCTTGRPYLPQGTAVPLKVRTCPIAGSVDWEVVAREVIWQADLSLTKPDTGIALPWVLHVADGGALQSSRSYRISGITA